MARSRRVPDLPAESANLAQWVRTPTHGTIIQKNKALKPCSVGVMISQLEGELALDRRSALLLPAIQDAMCIYQSSQHKYLGKPHQLDVHLRVLPPVNPRQSLALTVFLPSIYEILGYITAPLLTKDANIISSTSVSASDIDENPLPEIDKQSYLQRNTNNTDGREDHWHFQQAEPLKYSSVLTGVSCTSLTTQHVDKSAGTQSNHESQLPCSNDEDILHLVREPATSQPAFLIYSAC